MPLHVNASNTLLVRYARPSYIYVYMHIYFYPCFLLNWRTYYPCMQDNCKGSEKPVALPSSFHLDITIIGNSNWRNAAIKLVLKTRSVSRTLLDSTPLAQAQFWKIATIIRPVPLCVEVSLATRMKLCDHTCNIRSICFRFKQRVPTSRLTKR